MKEKKVSEKKKGHDKMYTSFGIRGRKVLCMLMFAGFMAGFYFLVFAKFVYGFVLFTGLDYFDSAEYATTLQNTVGELIMNVSYSMENQGIQKEFSIYDVEKGTITTYDAAAVADEDFFLGEENISDWERLKKWEIEKEEIDFDLASLKGAREFLYSEYAKDCYLYFTPEAFISLFKKSGVVNTNQKLELNHSEETYIVYWDQYYTLADQGFHFGESDKDDIFKYNTTDVPYAMYDPAENLFYSTSDAYFEIYSQYIYDCGELKSYLDENEGLSEQTDSFVIPLLACVNMNETGIGQDIRDSQNYYQVLQEYFEQIQNSCFLYYLVTDEKIYNNVQLADLAKRAEYAYIMLPNGSYEEGKTKTAEKLQAGYRKQYGKSINMYNELSETFHMHFPSNAVLYFGIDLDAPDVAAADIGKSYYNWTMFRKYVWPFTIAAGVCFVLLLVLAVSLFITTGRKGHGDTEVMTYKFDRLPLELWLVIACAVTIGLAVLDICIADYLYMESEDILATAIPYGIVCIPFGIAFMEFNLSLARRIKAKNLCTNLLIMRLFRRDREKKESTTRFGRFVKRIKQRITQYYKASRYKLIFWMAVFLILQIPSIILFVECNGDAEIFGFALLIYIGIILLAGIRLWRIEKDIATLSDTVHEIAGGNMEAKCQLEDTFYLFQDLDDGIKHIGDGLKKAVETSVRDERMKTELITNVSHDLKTPLTSIINYIDLLKKEEMPNDEAKHYIEVLEAKAQRLKQLTEDLVEAAKATSGNIELEMMPLAFDELMKQALGEFEDKFKEKKLFLIAHYPKEPAVILADGRRLYRIIENVLQNAYKYALEGTRIYADLSNNQKNITFTLKNVSAAQLNISPEELMERFTRGDASRTTEGSGLGLTIARDLTKLMDGSFEIMLDGDLFKVIVAFMEYESDR